MTLETERMEKSVEIAKERIAQIESDAKAKAESETKAKEEAIKQQEESKGASEEKKTEGNKEEERILNAKDEELSEEDKAKKSKLMEDKDFDKLTPDDKARRVQEKAQKRIDELVGELKSEKHSRVQDSEKLKQLMSELESVRKELTELREPQRQVSIEEQIKSDEINRLNKYLDEDTSKPKEQRREMTKEELDEWFVDDPTEATAWIQRREMRRAEDRNADKQKILAQGKADEFITNQNKSKDKLMSKYPQINVSDRIKELKGQGKTDEEVQATLTKENEVFRTFLEIVNSDPQKYAQAVNGPELVMEELDKRLTSNNKKKTYTEEEVNRIREEAAEQERKRIESIDEGTGSDASRRKVNVNTNKQYPLFDKQMEVMRRRWPTEKEEVLEQRLKDSLDRRSKIPGVNIYEDAGKK